LTVPPSGNNELREQTFSAKYVIDLDEHCLVRLTLTQCDGGSCTDQATLLVASPNGNQGTFVGGVDNQVAKGEFIRVVDHRQPNPSYPAARIFASADGAAFVLIQTETDAPFAGLAWRQ
jgi:hypothetical protein